MKGWYLKVAVPLKKVFVVTEVGKREWANSIPGSIGGVKEIIANYVR